MHTVNSGLQLNYNGSKRLSTSSSGVSIDGRLKMETNHLNLNDFDLRNVRGFQMKDWDDDTGGGNGKYRLLARDGAFMFYNGGLVVGSYSNNTLENVSEGTAIIKKNLGIGITAPTEKIDIDGTVRLRGLQEDSIATKFLVANDEGKVFFRSLSSDPTGGGQSGGSTNLIDSKSNIVIGENAFEKNTGGAGNLIIGNSALKNNTTGTSNIAVGTAVLLQNTTGNRNVVIGGGAFFNNKTGNNNTALGFDSGATGGNSSSLTNVTALGHGARVSASNTVQIGNHVVTQIGGQVSWSTLSDGRFKKNIEQNIPGLAFINKLKPVSYQVDQLKLERFLKVERQNENTGQVKENVLSQRTTGFIAQDVQKILDQEGYTFSGISKPENNHSHYSIRYAEFVVPLTKAVQELSTIVNHQKSEIEELKTSLAEISEKDGKASSTDEIINKQIELFQNVPNPFSAKTIVNVKLPRSVVDAKVIIYDLRGTQLHEVLISTRGETQVSIAGNTLQSGMYIYALLADGKVIDTKKMILTK